MRKIDPIRLVHWGLGPIGLGMARLAWRRPGLMPVGAIDGDEAVSGRDLGSLMGFGERLGVQVSAGPEEVLAASRPDVTLLATGSRFEEVAPQIMQAMEAGSNVICVAEEMIYPWATRADLAEKLDDLAHSFGVTVLGTGVAPGFVLDTLIIALTGCCADVERIRASRVSAITSKEQPGIPARSVGSSPSSYMGQLERGNWIGPTGLEQSIHLIADSLGWKLGMVEEDRQPVIAQRRRELAGMMAEPGQVAGTYHAAIGQVDGRARILLEQSRQLAPETEGIEVGDFIEVEGEPDIRLALQPGIPDEKGTVAIAVNMIGAVLLSGPGLKTMADMPIPRAVLGDLREYMHVPGPTIEEELARGVHDWAGLS